MKSTLALLAAILIVSCTEPLQNSITSVDDYEEYFAVSSNDAIQNLKAECTFWSDKINEQPSGFTYLQKLGIAKSKLFEKTGDINYLIAAESDFNKAGKLLNGKYSSQNLLTLSSLAIKRHQFELANQLAIGAQGLSEEIFASVMMQYDSEMELGNYEMAESILNRNKRFDSFDFLVRLSNFKDYQGNLDSAIVYMEKALGLVSHEESPRATWAKANLGDMYGHAGRIEESYKKYLQVLEEEPDYDYALRGIAWIAFSADGNLDEARRILMHLSQKTVLPDTYLLLAEVASESKDLTESKEWINKFKQEAQKEKYGDMYNKYLISLSADESDRYKEAIALAQTEVSNRPTPATYDWLAWAHYRKGDHQKAADIYAKYVEGKTYEPEPVYHMGIVYKNTGQHEKGLAFLKESLEASYELGPKATRKIKEELTNHLASR